MDGVKYPKKVKIVIELIGKKTKNVKMLNVDEKAVAGRIKYGKGVSKDAVTYEE